MTNCTAEIEPDTNEECRFIEVLTAEISGEVIGYRFGGSLPGPSALVAGDDNLIEALFDRLNGLPTFPWMWGKLYLFTLDGVECSDMEDVKAHMSDTILDELIMLPNAKDNADHSYAVDRAYWATLRLCRRLGMIQGRGVKAN